MNRNSIVGTNTPVNNIISNTDIKVQRISSLNKIKDIDFKLEKINNKELKFGEILELSKIVFGKVTPLNLKIDDLNQKISEYKLLYPETDKSFKLQKSKRDILISDLKQKTIDFLNANKTVLQAQIQANMRPKNVLIKYKELMREVSRDELTLLSLEN